MRFTAEGMSRTSPFKPSILFILFIVSKFLFGPSIGRRCPPSRHPAPHLLPVER